MSDTKPSILDHLGPEGKQMGISTMTDVVPFACQYFIEGSEDHPKLISDQQDMLLNPHAYKEGEQRGGGPALTEVVVNGWTYKCFEKIGKRGHLTADRWEDDQGNVVWLLNESEYECVGEYELTVIGDTREAVAKFVNVQPSCGRTGQPKTNLIIEETVAVQSTT